MVVVAAVAAAAAISVHVGKVVSEHPCTHDSA